MAAVASFPSTSSNDADSLFADEIILKTSKNTRKEPIVDYHRRDKALGKRVKDLDVDARSAFASMAATSTTDSRV